MPLEFITYDDFVSLVIAEFRTENPDIDPTVDEFSRGFNNGLAAACLTLQSLIRDLELEAFPQTATGSDLERWGAYENLPRNAASAAFGVINVPATIVGEVVPIGAVYNSDGLNYSPSQAAAAENITGALSSLIRVGSTVTATFENHGLATGQTVNISGADQTEYNGDFTINVNSEDTFTYSVEGSPTTPATGTIIFSSIFASVPVVCTSTGLLTNRSSGSVLTLTSTPITNVSTTGFVTFSGLVGGAAEETDEGYRSRILLSRSTIEGVFTNDQIELAALGVAGNTRAFVISPELSTCSGSPTVPTPGQVAVYILRDNDPNITPTQVILDRTKEAIIENGRLPSNTSELDVFVLAPTLTPVNFTISGLTPDTSSMRSAVTANLQAFFEDNVQFGTNVTRESYLGAIQNTQDLITGDIIETFNVNTPAGDVSVGATSIAVIGTVNYV